MRRTLARLYRLLNFAGNPIGKASIFYKKKGYEKLATILKLINKQQAEVKNITTNLLVRKYLCEKAL